MTRATSRLTARQVSTVKVPGKYGDGGGLYLLVRKRGNSLERLWIFRYRRGTREDSRETALSLGPVRDVGLAEARDLAALCRNALAKGEDPRSVLKAGAVPTFGEAADALVDDLEAGWRNEKHRAQWRMTLTEYAKPLRAKRVDEITTDDVLECLKPVWLSKPETASRLRGRIERVLDAAKAKGQRSGENPARWRGHLKNLLPARQRLSRGHHRALPYNDVPSFLERLRALDSVSALALEWTILTAARTGETIGAKPSEIDRESRVWTVPAERMKAKRPHRVPLPARCLEIIDELKPLGSAWLFPSRSIKRHISNMAMAECLKGLTGDATVHGFRSSFRDWAGECTSFPREVIEASLAHLVGDATERAYRRGDALERRRELMEAWARYCTAPAGNVIALRR